MHVRHLTYHNPLIVTFQTHMTTTLVAPPLNPPALTHLSFTYSASTSLLSSTYHNRIMGRSSRIRWAGHRKLVDHGPVKAMASLGGLLGGIFKSADTGESTRNEYRSLVEAVNKLENEVCALSDMQLQERTCLLKQRATRGDSLDSLLPVSH